MSIAKNQRDALSIRSSEQNKFPGGHPLQGINAALKTGDMDLQLVTVRVEKVERVTLAVVLLPLLRSGVDQPGTKRLVVRCRYSKRDVVVCRIHAAFGQVRFQCQTYPEIACREVRALVPASYRTKPDSQSILPTSFQERAQTAVAGGKAIRSISLTGTAEWFAGSVHETGTAQLLANADGSTSIQLDLGKASRTETQTNSPRTCQWADSTGKSHEISIANCFTSVPWFAPNLVTQFSAQPPSNMVSTDDGEVAKDQSSFHQISYSLNLAQTSKAMTKRIAKASTTRVLFDSRTFLPASLEYAIHPDEDDLQSLDVKVVFSDYRSVAGVQLPFHIERFVNRSLQLKLDISNASIE